MKFLEIPDRQLKYDLTFKAADIEQAWHPRAFEDLRKVEPNPTQISTNVSGVVERKH